MGWADNEDDKRTHEWKGTRYQRTERRGGKVIDEYIYTDERGAPYHRVERTDDKQFPQSHWIAGVTGVTRGYWKYGAPKIKLPYYLPDLIKAPAETPVFTTEGEKDAETLASLDLLSTCAPGGAGKWPAEVNKWFEGRKQVFILADNDKPGRKHALKVARNLSRVVGEVRIVHFTKLPSGEPMAEGGDVSDWVEAGGTKEQLLQLAAAAPVFVGLPTVQVVAGQHARVQDETEAAMIRAALPVLVRAGKLVEPIWSEYPTTKGGKTTITVLRPLTASNLAYMITKHAATFVKFDNRSKSLVPTDPPITILQGLSDRGHWGFPRVSGVINAPTLRPDGSILDQPGHDAATGMWCWPDPNLAMPAIPARPTKDQARAALIVLTELLSEFPFVEKVDRSVALAAMLTAVLRGAFDLAPLFLFLAHAAGTGKSYLANLIATVVHGRPCPVITVTRNSEEMEKRLGALLLEGAPIISLDNLSDNLEGDLLCQMIEQPLVKPRILGKSEVPVCEFRGTIFATGNNVTLSGDMTRRGLICNLDAGTERPEMREFKFDPVEKVLANRGTYIAAAIVMARAYVVSGERVDCLPLASFGGWCRFTREPLIWLGESDPVASMDQARANDPERSAAVSLVELWHQHLKIDNAYSVGEIIECAREMRATGAMGVGVRDDDYARPEFHSLLLEKCGNRGMIDAKALGKWLSQIKGQVHVGHRVEIAKQSSKHGNRWRLVKMAGPSEVGG